MSVLVGVSVALLVAWAAASERFRTERIRELKAQESRPAGVGPMTRLGGSVWRAVAKVSGSKRNLTDQTKQYIGCSLGLTVPVLLVSRPLGLVLGAAAVVKPVLEARKVTKTRVSMAERDLPILVDLFGVAITSGLNVPMATAAVAKAVPAPWSDELNFALVQVRRGARIADALEDVVLRTAESTRPLFSALASAERYGAPLAVLLERVAHETRVDYERRVERAAKKLSLQLLFPVAGCTLPAFALLTVAPLIAGSFGTLASSFH